MEASFVFKKFDVEVVSSIFKKYPLTKGIFSTVIDKDDELVEYLGSNLRNFVFLDETVSLPIKVQYKTPKTLGKDRLAAAVGANYLQPEKDLLVIDAGTAITYELIDASFRWKAASLCFFSRIGCRRLDLGNGDDFRLGYGCQLFQ